MNLQQQIDLLNRRVQELSEKIDLLTDEERIREIVFFDVDASTTTTRTASDSNGDTIVVPKNPTKYFRIYYKGQAFNVAGYLIS